MDTGLVISQSQVVGISLGVLAMIVIAAFACANWLNTRFEKHVTKQTHDDNCAKMEQDTKDRFLELKTAFAERFKEIKDDTALKFGEIKEALNKQNEVAAEDRTSKNNILQAIVTKLALVEVAAASAATAAAAAATTATAAAAAAATAAATATIPSPSRRR